MLSVGAPATSTEKYPYVLADALGIFFFSLLSLFLFYFRSSFLCELTCYNIRLLLVFCLFSFVMACFGVILVFSDLAVFLWCWRLYVSEGAKITLLIFIFVDFAFLIGEKFNFAGLCFGIFLVLLYAGYSNFFLNFNFLTKYLGSSWICVKISNSFGGLNTRFVL